jgi:hypothetical protein
MSKLLALDARFGFLAGFFFAVFFSGFLTVRRFADFNFNFLAADISFDFGRLSGAARLFPNAFLLGRGLILSSSETVASGSSEEEVSRSSIVSSSEELGTEDRGESDRSPEDLGPFSIASRNFIIGSSAGGSLAGLRPRRRSMISVI